MKSRKERVKDEKIEESMIQHLPCFAQNYFSKFIQKMKDEGRTVNKTLAQIIWRDTLKHFALECEHPIRTYFMESKQDYECECCQCWVFHKKKLHKGG